MLSTTYSAMSFEVSDNHLCVPAEPSLLRSCCSDANSSKGKCAVVLIRSRHFVTCRCGETSEIGALRTSTNPLSIQSILGRRKPDDGPYLRPIFSFFSREKGRLPDFIIRRNQTHMFRPASEPVVKPLPPQPQNETHTVDVLGSVE
jgi:hypothetical protein